MVLAYQAPINPNTTQKTKDLLSYLYSISGTKTLTGMHNYFEDPNYWTNQVKYEFNVYPAVQGFEMGALLGQDLGTQANMRQATANAVIAHHKRGGICHMSWHQNFAFKPFDWNTGVHCNSVPQADFDRLVTPGTAEYNWLISEYDRAAPYFKQIRDANVPLIMRPYHEMNAPWFWWGHQPNYYKLWDIMYDRFTNYYGLNNILWLWSANNPKNAPNEKPYPDYFVGTNKCDILGTDVYLWVTAANAPGGEAPDMVRDHDGLVAISGGKPVVLSEIGHVISEAVLNTTRFAYFLEWGDYYRNPITVWSGDTIPQNTAANRASMFGTVNRFLNLNNVSIPAGGAAPPTPPTPPIPVPIVNTFRHLTENEFAATNINSVPKFVGQPAVIGNNIYFALGTLSTSDWFGPFTLGTGGTIAPSTLFSDNFDGADSTTGLGSSWTAQANVFGRLANRAYVPSNTDGAVVYLDVARVNYTLSALMNGFGWANSANASLPELLVRYIDVNNFIYSYIYNNQIFISKVDGGVESTIGSASVSVAESSDHTFKLVVNGSSIKLYLDTVLKVDVTLSSADASKYGSSTKVGMKLQRFGAPTSEAKWDNFTVMT